MTYNQARKWLFVSWVPGVVLLLSAAQVHAVPSFARQTGMACTVCHTVFPELTPFGRSFKLHAYTFSTASPGEPYRPPIAAMFQASVTALQENHGVLRTGVAPFDSSDRSARDEVNLPQQASLFYGGQIIDHFGALSQVTYDGTADDIALDLTDLRYGRTSGVGDSHLTYGLTVNNSPTVEDVWNSTPTWGFPYASSAVAPTPTASPLIAGGLDQQVGGLGAYASWNNVIYAAVTVYRTTEDGIARPLGAGTDVDTVTDGAVPYWRLALQYQKNAHAMEVGTYGLKADVHPDGRSSGPTDKFVDLALDGQYQYINSPHLFSVQATWIHEKQDWSASYDLDEAANHNSSLDLIKVNASYYYRSEYGAVGGSMAYFSTNGDKDVLLYSPDPVDGSRTGSPDSNGFILEADYVFREKYKFSLQYTIYDKFNGSSSDYDGFGRNASDNNTLYFLVWLMF